MNLISGILVMNIQVNNMDEKNHGYRENCRNFSFTIRLKFHQLFPEFLFFFFFTDIKGLLKYF